MNKTMNQSNVKYKLDHFNQYSLRKIPKDLWDKDMHNIQGERKDCGKSS